MPKSLGSEPKWVNSINNIIEGVASLSVLTTIRPITNVIIYPVSYIPSEILNIWNCIKNNQNKPIELVLFQS